MSASDPHSTPTPASSGPPPAAGPPDPAGRARRRAAEAEGRARELEGRLQTNSRLRVGAFVVGTAAFLLLETSPRDIWPLLLAVGGIAAVGFMVLVRRHQRLGRKHDRELLRKRLQEEALARMDRRWDQVPCPPLAFPGANHAFADDLDVLGRSSLAHLLGRVNTAPGRSLLRRTLLRPLDPPPTDPADLLVPERGASESPAAGRPSPGWEDRLQARQRAVARLSRIPDLMDELELGGRIGEGAASAGATLAFLEWAREEPWIPGRRWIVPAAQAIAIFNVGTLAAWLAGWLAPPIWLLGMLAAHGIHRVAASEAHRRFQAAEAGEGDPARWAALLDVARELPDDEPVLARIRDAAMSPAPGAAGILSRLRGITDVASVRYSGLAHFPLVTLFAWDIHVLERMERWQTRYGAQAERWVQAVAELELLVALAGLQHEHPTWQFPTFVTEAGAGIRARDLGHPLLPPTTCVGNDVELPEPGRLLLVTGSNMAGKTTLLRALGANQILALAGGPVAAAALETRPVLPWTAMRVQDSVTEGVSFFMAELQRLRRVVDAAWAGPILFLLDEILQGTNTAERRTAARIVLRHLLDTDGVGAVTTHDLTLADAPDLKERSVDIHFREDVVQEDGERRLHFDYRLRPGPATSRNALLLLELVGLGEEGGPSPDSTFSEPEAES